MNDRWWLFATIIIFGFIKFGTSDVVRIGTYVCDEVAGPFLSRPAERCSASSTTKTFSNIERQWTLYFANLFRGQIANKCDAVIRDPPAASNYRRLEWSCEFEDELEFECPADLSSFESDSMTYRYYYNTGARVTNLNDEHQVSITHPLWYDGSRFRDRYHEVYHLRWLFLNENATEIGCYQKVCTFYSDYYVLLACKNNFELDKLGQPFKSGDRCRRDSDCTIAPHLECDQSFGLCQSIQSCRLPIYHNNAVACSKLNADHSFVTIASKTKRDLYDLKGIATIVGKRHLLTSISHFASILNSELSILFKNSFNVIKNKKLNPTFYVSMYNLNAWADFVLITLDEKSISFSDNYINHITSESNGTKFTVDKNLSTKEIQFQSVEHCEEAFSVDDVHYDKNTMYCAEDNVDNIEGFLSGSPIYVETSTGTKLMGIRSINSIHPKFKRTYMIQKLDKHCDWLATASYGNIKCTEE